MLPGPPPGTREPRGPVWHFTRRNTAGRSPVRIELAARGSKLRIVGAAFFTVGRGVPDFRQLRTGARWPDATDLTYLIDASDLTHSLPQGCGRIRDLRSSRGKSWRRLRTRGRGYPRFKQLCEGPSDVGKAPLSFARQSSQRIPRLDNQRLQLGVGSAPGIEHELI